MKKFVIVKEECKYKEEYIKYKENQIEVNKYVNTFFSENGIQTKEYYIGGNQLYIVPTEEDLEKFNGMLNNSIDYGLRGFKKRGKINKKFLDGLKENNIELIDRPMLWMYINFSGKISISTFIKDGVMYAEINTESNLKLNEKYFKEIKGSEYYAIIESEDK